MLQKLFHSDISSSKKKQHDYGRNVVLQDLLSYVTIFQLHTLIYRRNSNIQYGYHFNTQG
jgi:hypothetical protein